MLRLRSIVLAEECFCNAVREVKNISTFGMKYWRSFWVLYEENFSRHESGRTAKFDSQILLAALDRGDY
jgi:hypothetical protein